MPDRETMDSERVDTLLRSVWSAPAPAVSPTFVQDVLRRSAPRVLTTRERGVLWAYAVVSVALCAWLMRDLPVAVIAGALVVAAIAAGALRAYTTSLARALDFHQTP